MGMFKRRDEAGDRLRQDLQAKMAAISRSQAVIEFELDGSVIDANDNFCQAMGYARDEVIGRHHSLFMDPVEARGQAYGDFWRDLNHGRFVSGRFGRVAHGGREIWLQASYNPVMNDAGAPCRVIKIAVDITASVMAERQAESERVASEAAQTRLVQIMAGQLSGLAHGDLSARITEELEGDHGRIRNDYNRAVESLAETMGAIAAATGSLRAGSDEIANASDDLSRRTEQQAASLEETAAALDQITATVKRSAEGARQAATAATGARTEAARSGEVMRDAVSAMGEIEESSTRITEIIGVIDEIAFQTNLLALNAGVEAARAGDAGRGFAVVASEVRALAQRSAGAAKEIKTLIASSSAQVQRGVKLVGETGAALGDIVSRVAEIDVLISEMASSSQEQATGLNQVNTAVNQMDQVTQQNAAMVEEATAAANSLKSEANQLAVLIARFKTGLERPEDDHHEEQRRRGPVLAMQSRLRQVVGGLS